MLYVFILRGCSWLWAIFKGHINSTLLLKQLEIKSYSPGSPLPWLESFQWEGPTLAAMRASSGLFKWLMKRTEVPSYKYVVKLRFLFWYWSASPVYKDSKSVCFWGLLHGIISLCMFYSRSWQRDVPCGCSSSWLRKRREVLVIIFSVPCEAAVTR